MRSATPLELFTTSTFSTLYYGPAIGVLATCSVDLVLEPLAYYTGIWIWLQPYTPQIYFGSTVANALVWTGMCLIGIKFWEANINAR